MGKWLETTDAEKDWGKEEKGVTEDEIVGWHHQLNGYESEQTLEESEGQGSLACYSPWGCRVRHGLTTKQQQWVNESHVFLTKDESKKIMIEK